MTNFIPAASTAGYLAQLPADVRERAIDYTHGSHWLLLLSALVGVIINLIIIRWGLLERVQARWQRRRPRPWSAAFAVAVVYYAAAWLLDLPWAVYSKWWREVHYGLSTQGLGAWIGQSLVSACFSALLVACLLMLLYALMRRAPRRWWLWSSAVTSAIIVFAIVIVPVVVEPRFNNYQPLPAGSQRDAIAALASEAGIAADRIVWFDGSKQSSNYTANVTGLFGTARIAVSDTLLNQASSAELRAVVAHEIGHYVMHHALLLALAYSALLTLAFFVTHLLYAPLVAWLRLDGLHALSNPAGLPLLSIIVTLSFVLLTPVTNGLTRYVENQADVYSLAHAREPDGMAIALLRTADYRAPEPGALEEWLFYDHPSIARRIQRAMALKTQAATVPPAAPASAPPSPLQQTR
ncbi:M48 family metalloprotease [Duganella callida]|uniref:M48 family peptidase n=1 Tax=Duganella callida TaxID=2561932 RepID=A0A4Y9SSK1_9BURK|nr:M48 family metalloprotease [Duganella callida]TFW27623.1 M48 family peptidase [Duganella callida]